MITNINYDIFKPGKVYIFLPKTLSRQKLREIAQHFNITHWNDNVNCSHFLHYDDPSSVVLAGGLDIYTVEEYINHKRSFGYTQYTKENVILYPYNNKVLDIE